MPHIPRRVPSTRLVVTVLFAVGLLLGASGCGFYVQTNRPYTPAQGVNVDVGTVHVRNLMILSRERGQGFLSASLSADGQDALLQASGTTITDGDAPGTALKVTLPDPVALGPNRLVVLTDRPLITVTSPDLDPGLTATMVLQFSKAGRLTIVVPVVDANEAEYKTISPTPAPSAS